MTIPDTASLKFESMPSIFFFFFTLLPFVLGDGIEFILFCIFTGLGSALDADDTEAEEATLSEDFDAAKSESVKSGT